MPHTQLWLLICLCQGSEGHSEWEHFCSSPPLLSVYVCVYTIPLDLVRWWLLSASTSICRRSKNKLLSMQQFFFLFFFSISNMILFRCSTHTHFFKSKISIFYSRTSCGCQFINHNELTTNISISSGICTE